MVFLASDKTVKPLLSHQSVNLSKLFADARPRSQKILYFFKQKSILKPFFKFLENRIIPGIQVHYLLRKLRIEEITRAALEKGFRQIVVFGAGFDTLALRLHSQFPLARFIEADFPATQRAKLEVIEKENLGGFNLSFVALDVTTPDGLRTLAKFSGFQPGLKTLFIAEGLLMYLTLTEINKLFEIIRFNSSPKSLFAFTFMEKSANGKIRFQNSSRLVDVWLKLHGEPFKSSIGLEEISDFLAEKGFDLKSLDTAETFRKRYLNTPELEQLKTAAGESLCLAGRI